MSQKKFKGKESLVASVLSDDKPVPFESFESKSGVFIKMIKKRKLE
jgi:hypothetical protein